MNLITGKGKGIMELRLRTIVINFETELNYCNLVFPAFCFVFSHFACAFCFWSRLKGSLSNLWQHQSGVSQLAEVDPFPRTCILLNTLKFCSGHSNKTSESQKKTLPATSFESCPVDTLCFLELSL